jgi:hypothetical protein
MPRSFAAWNEKRRPIARCATSPHAQPPEGFSHTQPTSPQIQGLNIDELVSQLTENELMLAPSAASLQPALLLGSEAEWSPPPDTALIHPVAAGQPEAMVTDALPLAAGQMGPGTCAIAIHPAAHVPAHLHAPVGGPSRVGATFAAAGPSSDEGATEPPLVWSACRCPVSADSNGVALLPREMRRDGASSPSPSPNCRRAYRAGPGGDRVGVWVRSCGPAALAAALLGRAIALDVAQEMVPSAHHRPSP